MSILTIRAPGISAETRVMGVRLHKKHTAQRAGQNVRTIDEVLALVRGAIPHLPASVAQAEAHPPPQPPHTADKTCNMVRQ
jgi:hypothetical protein